MNKNEADYAPPLPVLYTDFGAYSTLGGALMLGKLYAAVVVWLLFVVLAWALLLRRMPSSPLEWFALVVLGPPAYFLASFVAEGAFNLYNRLPGVRHLHAFAERRAAGKEVSWLRIAVYLVSFLVLFGIIFLLGSLLHAL